MSRIGKKPVAIPAQVKVGIDGQKVSVEGPKGKLERSFPDQVDIAIDSESNELRVTTETDDRESKAFHGLTRALIQNMVTGVVDGY